MPGKEYFISGIDTDCGKTYITGLLAYGLSNKGVKVITSKLVQTGCEEISEDILEHRRIMQIEVQPEDKIGLTCPYVFSYPSSPHLAAVIDGVDLDVGVIRKSIKELLEAYDVVLSEGAGGLMVPLFDNYLTINYIKDNDLPLVLVCSSKLGSINHTFLSLELCRQYNIKLHSLLFNKFPFDEVLIADNSFSLFKDYVAKNFPEAQVVHSDSLNNSKHQELKDQFDFEAFLG